MALNVRGSDSLYWGTGIDTTGLAQGAKKSKGILANLAHQISAMDIFAAISVGAIYHFKKVAKEAVLLGARFETLGVVLDIVGNTAGYTAEEMDELSKSLEKTGISMIGSRQMIVRMIQSQIDLKDATKLARVAQDAAVIGNINSTVAFEKLIHGIQTGEPRILRHIGIIVDFNKAYEKAAAAQGKNAEALTMMEKAQIRANEVLKQGEIIQGSYSAAMGTAGKLILSMQRYVEDLKVLLGEAFGPALSTAIFDITAKMKDLNKTLSSEEGQKSIKNWGENFNLALMSIQQKTLKVAATLDTIGVALLKTYEIMHQIYVLGTNPASAVLGPEGKPGEEQTAAGRTIASFRRREAVSAKMQRDIRVLINELNARKADALNAFDALTEKKESAQFQSTPAGRHWKKVEDAMREGGRLSAAAAAKSAQEADAAILDAAAANEAYLERYNQIKEIIAQGEEDITDAQEAGAQDRADAMEHTRAERLSSELDELTGRLALVSTWGDEYKGEVERVELEIVRVRGEISDLSTEKNKKALTEILKDTRKYNAEQLEAYKKRLETQAKLAKGNVALEIALNAELSDVIDELGQREIERLQNVSTAIMALSDLISTVDPATGKSIAEVGSLFSNVGAFAVATDPFEKISSGIGVVKSTIGLLERFRGQSEEHESDYIRQITLQNGLIKTQIDLQRTLNGSESQAAMDKVVELQRIKIALIEEEIARRKELGELGGVGIERRFRDGRVITTSTVELTEANQLLAEYELTAAEGITNTTADAISDGIVQGFKDGKRSSQDFADDFRNVMEKAVMDSISRSLTTDMVNDWLEQFAESMEGGLSQQEIDDLRKAYNAIVESGKTAYEAFEQVAGGPTGSTTTTTTGLTGAISGITEETAGLLAAQFNAIRRNTVSLLGFAGQGLTVNKRIRDVLIHRSGQAVFDSKRIATIRDNSYYIKDTYRMTYQTVQVLNDILIVNARTADNTDLLRHLVSIDKKTKSVGNHSTLENYAEWERLAGV